MVLSKFLLFPVLSDIKHWDYFRKDHDEAKQSLCIWISFLELVFLDCNHLLTQYFGKCNCRHTLILYMYISFSSFLRLLLAINCFQKNFEIFVSRSWGNFLNLFRPCFIVYGLFLKHTFVQGCFFPCIF